MSKDILPFLCGNCGERFGFGDGDPLMFVVSSLPFHRQPKPCCGEVISGYLLRNDNNTFDLEIIETLPKEVR